MSDRVQDAMNAATAAYEAVLVENERLLADAERSEKHRNNLFDRVVSLRTDVAALRAENERLREYAREATKAITSLTAGGSEYFGRKIGDIYTADLPFCLERIQRSKDLLHSLLKDERARTKAAEATIDRMIAERAALSEAQP